MEIREIKSIRLTPAEGMVLTQSGSCASGKRIIVTGGIYLSGREDADAWREMSSEEASALKASESD